MSLPTKTLLLGLAVASGAAFAGTPGDPPASSDPSPKPSTSPTPMIRTSFNGMLSGRYDVSTTPGNTFDRIQDSVVFGFTITPNGIVDLVGLAQTGSKYGKRFSTVIDMNDHSKDTFATTLYFKQLYLQKSFDLFGNKTLAQAGVIGTNQRIGTKSFVGPTTAIGTNGWIEGGRMTMETKAGTFAVTSGSIADIDQPEPQKRDLTLNYFEVQMSRQVLDKVALEASAGKYDGEVFIRGAVEYDVKAISEHVIHLVQEGLYSDNHFSYSAGTSTDIGVLISKKLEGRVNLDLRYSFVSPDAGFRGQAMNDVVLKGHVFSTALYGKVDRTGRLNWFAARDFGDVQRFQAGMNWKFKGGNKK